VGQSFETSGPGNEPASVPSRDVDESNRASFGQRVFALALAGMGVLSLLSGNFAYLFQPVPLWVLGRPVLAYASGALLLACGAGLLFRRTLARMSAVTTVYGFLSILLLHVPRIATTPRTEVEWLALGEIAAMVAGAWTLFAWAAPPPAGGRRRAVAGERGVRLARVLYALALLPIGLGHFAYTDVTAGMVPSWLPSHVTWAYLTGAGHVAAGLAILFGILARQAAMLEAFMVSIFVLTVHVPDVLHKPGGYPGWTELFVACAIGGASFIIARGYREPLPSPG